MILLNKTAYVKQVGFKLIALRIMARRIVLDCDLVYT